MIHLIYLIFDASVYNQARLHDLIKLRIRGSSLILLFRLNRSNFLSMTERSSHLRINALIDPFIRSNVSIALIISGDDLLSKL